MGALPGGGILIPSAAPSSGEAVVVGRWFDVERFRHAGRRVVVRAVGEPLLVLGSAQRAEVVDYARAARAGVEVVRRRGGGGAVLVAPGAQVWADMWIPATDPLWAPEPRRTAVHVGRWWAAALERAGVDAAVHDAPTARTPWSDLVCFAGVGPGEVLTDGRKVVGLAQWRSREGALVFGCAYARFDPALLAECLDLGPAARVELEGALGDTVTDLCDLGISAWNAEDLLAELPPGGHWDVVRG
jgi:lipoate-protein ligase A